MRLLIRHMGLGSVVFETFFFDRPSSQSDFGNCQKNANPRDNKIKLCVLHECFKKYLN